MTFAEKSAAASFLACFAGLGAYLWMVRDAENAFAVVPAMAAMAALAVLIQIVVHVGMLLQHRSTEEDERDRSIALLATRNYSVVLVFAVWGVIGLAILLPVPLLIANWALVSFTLAEIVRYGTQLYYYQRGL